MAIDLTFINAALTRTGSQAITSLDQGGAGAAIASQNYEVMVRAALAGYRWRWATTTAVLSQIDGDAPAPWHFAYQLPSDVLDLRNVSVCGMPVRYVVMSDKIMTNAGSDAEVVALYVWRPPESQWPPWFAEPFTQRLEAVFLRGTGERHAEADEREKFAEAGFMAARQMDAQSEPPEDPWRYPILHARTGFRHHRFW